MIDIYQKTLFSRLPIIISYCNKNKYSPTFGCFDRNFWHCKIIDTPSARLQEGALIFTLLYLDQESPFFQKEEMREWIKGALSFWLKIQNRDGSFNEVYPHEKSFVATAFSSYAISETLLLLPDIERKEEITEGLKKAADFLYSKRDNRALNQNTGALAALHNIFLLTGQERYKKECKKFIEFLKEKQNEEGWFSEYGGADIGYLSLSLDYLAKYYLKSKDEEASFLIEKVLSFLSYFLHPDGSSGGIYGSRNTAYLIPSGIEIMANFMPLARKLSSVLQESIQNNHIISPQTLDERYLIQLGYTYLEASRQLKQRSFSHEPKGAELPSAIFEEKHFPNAGILIRSTPRFYCIINYKKGGAFYFYDRFKKMGIYNSGLLLRRGKKIYSSSYLSRLNEINFSSDGKNISIKGKLEKVADCQPTPFRFVALRILLGFTHSLPYFSAFLKSLFRALLISRKTASSLYFERSFNISDNVLIKDRFPPGIFDKGQTGGIQELIYTISSRYFNFNLVSSEGITLGEKELRLGAAEYSL